MKKKVFNLWILILFFTSQSKAQNLTINGYIFCEDSSKVEAIPFATVRYYDYKDPKKLEYIDFTDLSGQYNLGQHVAQRDYHIEIEAPGYQKREKNIGKLPKSYKGNMTFHFKLHKDQTPLAAPISYAVDKMTGAKTLIDVIRQIPAVDKIEGTDVLSKDGGTIRVLVNGFTFNAEKLSQLSQFPIDVLNDVQYYDLKKYNTIYNGVINLVLLEGDMAGAPNFTPGETSYYDIKE